METHLKIDTICYDEFSSIEQRIEAVCEIDSADDFAKSKLASLSDMQILAISNYLNWCLTNEEYEFERRMIQIALDEYWSEQTLQSQKNASL